MKNLTPLTEGILWKLISCGAFALINVLVKYLSSGAPNVAPLPVYVIVFYQYVFGIFIMLPWLLRHGIGRTEHKKLHFFRVIFAVLGTGIWYYSLKYIPIAEAIALSFTGPIFTIIGAGLFLQERLTLPKVLSIGLCFFGAFLITRPDSQITSQTFKFAALLPLTAAIFFAASKLVTRKLASINESPHVLTAYLIIFVAPVAFIFALPDFVIPNLNQVSYLLILGIFVWTAHYSFARAYALLEVTYLMPFGFTKFILSSVASYLVFNELPSTANTWIGIIIIFTSIGILSFKPKDKTKESNTAIAQ